MGKEKRKRPTVWVVLLQGSMTALWIYMVGLFLVTLLLTKGVLPDNVMFPLVAGLCIVASLAGGLLVGNKATMGALVASMLNALVFSGILVLTGMACWHRISWDGKDGILVACAMIGGVFAGILSRSGRRQKKGRRARVAVGKRAL